MGSEKTIGVILFIGTTSIMLLLLILAFFVVFVCDIVVLLQNTDYIDCASPIYAWLAMAAIIQALALFNKNMIMNIINLVACIVLYIYGISYYNDKDLCPVTDATNSIFALMLTHIILISIVIGFVILYIFMAGACCCIYGTTLFKILGEIEAKKPQSYNFISIGGADVPIYALATILNNRFEYENI
jgi:hypothetical protein